MSGGRISDFLVARVRGGPIVEIQLALQQAGGGVSPLPIDLETNTLFNFPILASGDFSPSPGKVI